MTSLRILLACGLALIAIAAALALGNRARAWNDELALAAPQLAAVAPQLDERSEEERDPAGFAAGAAISVSASRSRNANA